VWINQGDIILLSLREFQDGKADVIVKYTADEARNRKSIQCYVLDMANADVGSQ
jgi:translation initiation factor 1A